MAAYLMESFSVSTTRACRVISLPKSMYYYESVKDDQPVIDKLNELVSMRVIPEPDRISFSSASVPKASLGTTSGS